MLQSLLKAADLKYLITKIKREGNSMLIDPGILEDLGLTLDNTGALEYKNDALGRRKITPVYTKSSDSMTGTPWTATVAPATATEIWEVTQIKATFDAAAPAANRTCVLEIYDGLVGVMATPATMYPHTALGALVANEEQFLLITEAGVTYHQTAKGTVAPVVNESILPMKIYGSGGYIQARISVNGQTGDQAGIDVIKRIVG